MTHYTIFAKTFLQSEKSIVKIEHLKIRFEREDGQK